MCGKKVFLPHLFFWRIFLGLQRCSRNFSFFWLRGLWPLAQIVIFARCFGGGNWKKGAYGRSVQRAWTWRMGTFVGIKTGLPLENIPPEDLASIMVKHLTIMISSGSTAHSCTIFVLQRPPVHCAISAPIVYPWILQSRFRKLLCWLYILAFWKAGDCFEKLGGFPNGLVCPVPQVLSQCLISRQSWCGVARALSNL